jgi:hypothetical protein
MPILNGWKEIRENEMGSNDQDKIRITREYFMRADQGRPDILELFDEDAEIYFPKFGFGFGRQAFLEMVKGFEGSLEYIQHDYDSFTFVTSGDYLIVEGTSHGRMSGKLGQGAKLLADVSATSSSFEMAEYRACTSISIPTIRVRMNRGFDGARIVNGDVDGDSSTGFY